MLVAPQEHKTKLVAREATMWLIQTATYIFNGTQKNRCHIKGMLCSSSLLPFQRIIILRII
jgi:hypothetical protein